MKKNYYWLIVMVPILLFSLVGCGNNSSSKTPAAGTSSENNATNPIVLKFSYGPPESGQYGKIYNYFAKTLEEESKGQIKCQMYPGGSLVSDQRVLDSVMQGTVDIGHFVVPYVDATVKEITPLEVPGAYSSTKFMEMEKATHPVIEKIFNKYGIHYLGAFDPGFPTFAASKKFGDPITTPEQLKGHTVRTAGKWDADVIKLWGGSPVTIPIGDLPNALQLGTVDISKTGFDLTESLKLYEIAPNVTVSDLSGANGGLIMSDKAWKNLNPEQQATVTRTAEKWVEYNHQVALEAYKEFETNVKKSGAKLIILNPEQNAAFGKATAQVMDQVKAISGPEGEELIKICNSLK